MDPRLIPYAERNLPRYTSYPTAPHFNPAVTAEFHADWLAAVGARGAPVSLYLHIPFCREICWYCGCNTKAARRQSTVDAYVATLTREIEHVATLAGRGKARRIHWGGGTPNILSPENFTAVIGALAAAFDLSGLVEHAIEIDPRTLTRAQAQTYADHGVTRVSLGVQDFNAHVQQAIGRIQPAATVASAVETLRAAGVAGMNFDLMYGLPHQSIDDVRASARMALDLQPDRLSVFGYAHVPWLKTRQRLIDAGSLPDVLQRSAQADAIAEVITGAGYVAIGFDHYARPDDPLAQAAASRGLRRNFQGYVDDDCDVLIGFGASSISSFPDGYAQNSADTGQWSRAIESGRLPTARGYQLCDDDRTRRYIIERLLCDFEVDLSEHGGAVAFADAILSLRGAQADGLVDIEGDRLSIPPQARRLARVIAAAFDRFHQDAPARHSRAV